MINVAGNVPFAVTWSPDQLFYFKRHSTTGHNQIMTHEIFFDFFSIHNGVVIRKIPSATIMALLGNIFYFFCIKICRVGMGCVNKRIFPNEIGKRARGGSPKGVDNMTPLLRWIGWKGKSSISRPCLPTLAIWKVFNTRLTKRRMFYCTLTDANGYE